jgi:hypothetical protein
MLYAREDLFFIFFAWLIPDPSAGSTQITVFVVQGVLGDGVQDILNS